MMRELTTRELYQALEYAKSIDETGGGKILARFQLDQPALAQTIFGVFPQVIAEQNQDMAHLFMDLCFDVICVFEKAFGPLPSQKTLGLDWLEQSASMLDAEVQALIAGKPQAQKIGEKQQDRFTERVFDSNLQTGLVNFMHTAIDEYASENPVRVKAARVTQTLIFTVIQLFGIMYDRAAAH
ncbi:hypothetical protein [Methylomonas methanica]|uniref:Uncharacterized protein n=1 Tax=Methylomonas methanica (strain DSM 25384 / MC09) TaxID=857087 RepID=G0A5Q4_METMM|nr:hypothetical protein [Methylomonas methanica]AEG02911.1 hypothetical protein Metme_4573 [Methylomonas methanica MC09]